MKGFIPVADAVTILSMAALFVLMLAIVPKLFSDFFDQLASATSDVVMRDLAGLISISAAASEDITITYHGSLEQINYSVNLTNRMIEVDMVKDRLPLNRVRNDTYAIDGLNKQLENYNAFRIIKTRTGTSNNYDFQGVE